MVERGARDELVPRGVEASEIQVTADPDGNTWTVQEIRARAEKPLLPR